MLKLAIDVVNLDMHSVFSHVEVGNLVYDLFGILRHLYAVR